MFEHEYETIIIIRPELDDAVTRAVIEKLEAVITDNGGHLLDRDDWGKRKLSYLVDKQLRGHYVRVHYVCHPTLVTEFERKIRIEDNVIRFMTIRLATYVDLEQRREAAIVARKQREEEAKRRAEQEAQQAAMAEYDMEDEEMSL